MIRDPASSKETEAPSFEGDRPRCCAPDGGLVNRPRFLVELLVAPPAVGFGFEGLRLPPVLSLLMVLADFLLFAGDVVMIVVKLPLSDRFFELDDEEEEVAAAAACMWA